MECAALVRAIKQGDLDRLIIPEAPLDVLAQQIVAACAAGTSAGAGSGKMRGRDALATAGEDPSTSLRAGAGATVLAGARDSRAGRPRHTFLRHMTITGGMRMRCLRW